MAGTNIFGELVRAQLENLSADPAAGPIGRLHWNTTEGRAKYDTGAAFRAFLANDAKCVLGNHATAANNIRLHRGASAVLQFVLGDDATAEGTLSTNLAQLSFKLETYATGDLPSAGTAGEGRLLYDTTLNKPVYNDGAAYHTLLDLDSAQTASGKTFTSPVLTTAPEITGPVTHTHVATPANPSAGFSKVYVKTGNVLTILGSDGVEREVAESTSLDPRNFIINGGFDVWQRNTTFTSIANGAYCADRWSYVKLTTGAAHEITRVTNYPTAAESGYSSQYSLKIDCTTADAAVAAGDVVALTYKMEGKDFQNVHYRQATLSFWVRATKTGVHCVAFTNSAETRTYVAEYTIDVTNTWEKKTITVTFDDNVGAWLDDNGIGLRIRWTLMAGSTYTTLSPSSWQAGNLYASTNQVNACDDAANNFEISQVMLNIGATALSFSRAGATFAQEVALCQRYYEKSYSMSAIPPSVTETGREVYNRGNGHALFNVRYAVAKRSAPTPTVYNPASTTAGTAWNYQTGAQINANAQAPTEFAFEFIPTGATSVDDGIGFQWIADAEL